MSDDSQLIEKLRKMQHMEEARGGLLGNTPAFTLAEAIQRIEALQLDSAALAWITSKDAIEVADKRDRLTQDAVGIGGFAKPSRENAMGAVLVAVHSAAIVNAQTSVDTGEGES